METIPAGAIDELYQWCKRPDANLLVTSPEDPVYNCIAFAMGSKDMWVATGHLLPDWGAWWPAGVAKDLSPESLIAAFEALGFEKCDNILPEDGYDKVVLYQKYDDTFKRVIWTHAAKVIGEHRLHSKFGRSYDAQHNDGNIFEGYVYGTEYAYMRRPVEKRNLTEDLLPKHSHYMYKGVKFYVKYKGQQMLECRPV